MAVIELYKRSSRLNTHTLPSIIQQALAATLTKTTPRLSKPSSKSRLGLAKRLQQLILGPTDVINFDGQVGKDSIELLLQIALNLAHPFQPP